MVLLNGTDTKVPNVKLALFCHSDRWDTQKNMKKNLCTCIEFEREQACKNVLSGKILNSKNVFICGCSILNQNRIRRNRVNRRGLTIL